MTLTQEIFDKVATHLLAQGARSANDDGCLYRDLKNDRKCALGCLMTDEEYTPEWEKQTFYDLSIIYPDDPWVMKYKPFGLLLSDLQVVHDTCQNWHDTNTLKLALTGVAVKHGLNDAVLIGLTIPKKSSNWFLNNTSKFGLIVCAFAAAEILAAFFLIPMLKSFW